jgi:hypothetical protein
MIKAMTIKAIILVFLLPPLRRGGEILPRYSFVPPSFSADSGCFVSILRVRFINSVLRQTEAMHINVPPKPRARWAELEQLDEKAAQGYPPESLRMRGKGQKIGPCSFRRRARRFESAPRADTPSAASIVSNRERAVQVEVKLPGVFE